jgi:hypothetical protein
VCDEGEFEDVSLTDDAQHEEQEIVHLLFSFITPNAAEPAPVV